MCQVDAPGLKYPEYQTVPLFLQPLYVREGGQALILLENLKHETYCDKLCIAFLFTRGVNSERQTFGEGMCGESCRKAMTPFKLYRPAWSGVPRVR